MSTTDNLALTLVETNQSQKEVTVNTAFAGIDAAVCNSAAVAVVDGANAVSAATARGAQHLLLSDGSPAPTAAFDVVLPAIKRLLIITNATSFDATVACSGAATGASEEAVAAGASRLVYCDGTQVFGMSADAVIGGVAFTDLSDAPASYTGAARKFLRVNAAGAAVEFSSGELVINAQTGTAYTLALSDAGALVTLENASAITLTVPDQASVDFPVGTQILLAQLGAGQVTVAEGATGVMITTPETLKLRKTGAQAALVKIGADAWLLEGNLEAA